MTFLLWYCGITYGLTLTLILGVFIFDGGDFSYARSLFSFLFAPITLPLQTLKVLLDFRRAKKVARRYQKRF